MKRITILIVLCLFAYSSEAQIWAMTEKGDTIYVYNDGTWSYDKLDAELSDGIDLFGNLKYNLDTVRGNFATPKSSKKLVRSQYDFFSINFNENEWKRVPAGTLNDDAEFAFQSKTKDLYVAVITEEIEMGTENLFKIAIQNMNSGFGGEAKILKSEVRKVNGSEIIRGVALVDYQGLKLTFDSYYYSDPRGSIQFTTWTGSAIHDKYETEILSLLNGLKIDPVDEK